MIASSRDIANISFLLFFLGLAVDTSSTLHKFSSLLHVVTSELGSVSQNMKMVLGPRTHIDSGNILQNRRRTL